MGRRGLLFVISGPAGAGKSNIVQTLLERHREMKLSISCTTRQMRVGEREGESYYFVDDARFDELVKENAFYEWARVHNNRYGTLKSAVDKELVKGHDMILEIDVQGYKNVIEQNPDAVGIFICPPSRENLEERLRSRGTESDESLRTRLNNAATEVAFAKNYHYVIIHRDWNDLPNALDIAVDEVYAIINATRNKIENRCDFIENW